MFAKPVINLFIIFLISWISAAQAFNAKLEFTCQRIFNYNHSANTRILLHLPSQDTLGREYQIIFQFRQGTQTAFEMSRYVVCSQNNEFFEFWANLPVGYYEVWAEAQMLNNSIPKIVSKSFQARELDKTCVVSDVTLLQSGTLKPIVGKDIPGSGEKFDFSCEVYAHSSGLLTARAVLYRQDENPYSDAAGKYSSLGQLTVPVLLDASGRFRFENSLPAESLESGSYLIEIFVYQEDQIIAESNLSFNILWDKVPDILLNPGTYLPYMSWKFPGGIIPTELNNPEDFIQHWILQNEISGAYPYTALEEYFQRVAEANAFIGIKDAWNSAPGKYYILLGPPDSVVKTQYFKDSLLTWRYHAPPMCKYFIKPEGTLDWDELSSYQKIRLSL